MKEKKKDKDRQRGPEALRQRQERRGVGWGG